jgi:hypothetical protein
MSASSSTTSAPPDPLSSRRSSSFGGGGAAAIQRPARFGGEAEARIGLQQAEALRRLLGPKVAVSPRGLLIAALVGEGRNDDAKAVARDFCQSPADNGPKLQDLLAAAHVCD